MRGFGMQAKPEWKSRRRACDCYEFPGLYGENSISKDVLDKLLSQSFAVNGPLFTKPSIRALSSSVILAPKYIFSISDPVRIRLRPSCFACLSAPGIKMLLYSSSYLQAVDFIKAGLRARLSSGTGYSISGYSSTYFTLNE